MKVSVIIPCHNAEPYLAQTLGSLMEQARVPEEVIVVDDASTDRSATIARRFGERVRVVPASFGRASKARNYGFTFATGDALMFLDADDVLDPRVLSSAADALRSVRDGIALCQWRRLEKAGDKWIQRPPSWPPPAAGQDRLGQWLLGRYYPPCAVLWSRGAYERTGGWDDLATVNDDGDLMMRAMIDKVPLVEAVEGLAYYRRSPEGKASLSGTRFTETGLASGCYVLRKIAHMLEERGRIGRYHRALDAAFSKLAADARETSPQISRVCEAYRRRYGEPRWVPLARRKSSYWAARARRVVRRLAGKPLDPEPTEPPEEIRFGLASRTALEATAPPPRGTGRRPPPLVSVIIPTYNRANLVTRALDSVLGQNFSDFEVLVVDDGSTDETGEVLAAATDPRVRYLRQPENRGVSAARNRGLREARGELVAFLDSDDEWFAKKLARQVEVFREAPEDLGLVYTGVESINENGVSATFHPEHRGDVYQRLLEKNIIHSGSGVIVRRNVIRVAGFFDEEIPAIEDYDYWVRAARFYRFDFIEEPLLRYHDASGIERKSLATDDNLRAREWFFGKHHREMKRAGVAYRFLMESAQRHLIRDGGARDRWAAWRLAARAVAWAPGKYEPYSYLLRVILPEKLHGRLRKFRRMGDRRNAIGERRI